MPHGLKSGFATQCGEVSADKPIGSSRQILEVDIGRKRHSARMNSQDLATSRFVGNTDDDFAVEAPRTAECLVKRFGPIGRCNDDGILSGFDPVEKRQQLSHQPLFGFASHLAPLGRNRNRSHR